jgi:hypothetical protein
MITLVSTLNITLTLIHVNGIIVSHTSIMMTNSICIFRVPEKGGNEINIMNS